jgi:pilus assembly protein CpaE
MKIAILSSKQSEMESIRKVLMDSSAARHVRLFNVDLDALPEIVEHEHPDLVILDGVSTNAADLRMLERLLMVHPNIAVIELCENPDSNFLMHSMRVGVRDVLPLPLDSKALLASVLRVEQRLNPRIHVAQARGKVIAFIASKGGSGATFLATNLGYVLAAKENVKVALLDLNLQFGDAALFVSDQVPANSITDVTENISRVDASFFAANLVQVLPNYGLLAAPENPENAVGVKPEHIDVIMKIAKANFDYVILDIGRMLNAVSIRALDQADMIFPVLQETLPFIRDSKRLVHTLLSLGYAKEKIHLLLNRHEKSSDIKLKDVETALDMAVFKTIPNSYEAVTTSVNQGIPIYKVDKHDPVTKALLELSQQLEEKPQPKEAGWLSRMFQAA